MYNQSTRTVHIIVKVADRCERVMQARVDAPVATDAGDSCDGLFLRILHFQRPFWCIKLKTVENDTERKDYWRCKRNNPATESADMRWHEDAPCCEPLRSQWPLSLGYYDLDQLYIR